MATYDWPAEWCPNRFEMSILSNTRVFVGPYTPSVQTLDLLGERWQITLELPASNDKALGRAKEAFFDRLRGPINRIRMGNLRTPLPSGTQRGAQTINVVNGSLAPVTVVNGSLAPVTVTSGLPVTTAAIAAGASTASISGIPGRTYKAGDTIGLGAQMVRVLTDVTFDGAGQGAIEFAPRLRSALPINTAITYDRPTAVFMVQSETVPVTWFPGRHETVSLELIETY